MIALRDAILDFVAELRAAGIRVSVAESLDAMEAIARAGLERMRMREALAATLIKDEADRATFDVIFARRFAGPAPAAGAARRSRGERAGVHGSSGSPGASGLPAVALDTRDRDEAPTAVAPSRKQPQDLQERQEREPQPTSGTDRSAADEDAAESRGATEAKSFEDASERADHAGSVREESRREPGGEGFAIESPGIEAGRAAQLRSLERMPFANFSELEFESARDALAALKRRFRLRMSRRLRIARAGRIDFRRTIRASLQHGGALGDLRYRARRPRHIDLLILADISGSVKYASTLMLEIAAGARSCFRHVRSFVFIDRMAEAGFEQGHLTMTPPLDLYARSDFGRVLADVWERRAELVTRSTVIVIMGDGRNNRRPARADLLQNLNRLCRAVLWLTPEPRARWGTGDSAIGLYARAATALVSCANLEELERGLAQIR